MRQFGEALRWEPAAKPNYNSPCLSPGCPAALEHRIACVLDWGDDFGHRSVTSGVLRDLEGLAVRSLRGGRVRISSFLLRPPRCTGYLHRSCASAGRRFPLNVSYYGGHTVYTQLALELKLNIISWTVD